KRDFESRMKRLHPWGAGVSCEERGCHFSAGRARTLPLVPARVGRGRGRVPRRVDGHPAPGSGVRAAPAGAILAALMRARPSVPRARVARLQEGAFMIRRASTAFAFAALMLHAAVALPQGRDFSKVEIKTTKVAESVYMLEGSGGNI